MDATANYLRIVLAYDIWDVAWTAQDSNFLRSINSSHPKLRVRLTPFTGAGRAGDVASKQFAFLFHSAYPADKHADHIFIKLDDDIAFIDVPQFEAFIAARESDTESFLMSANVINHDHEVDWNGQRALHLQFLANGTQMLTERHGALEARHGVEPISADHRISFNFAAYLGADLPHIAEEFANGIGADDEWRVCCVVPPRLRRGNAVDQRFTVVHYAFGGEVPEEFLASYMDLAEQSAGRTTPN